VQGDLGHGEGGGLRRHPVRGAQGRTGDAEMLAPTSYIMGEGLGDKVAMVTDGRFSGGTRGATIGHVLPRGAAGGRSALVRNGDRIRLDIPQRKLDLVGSDAELAERRAKWRLPPKGKRPAASGSTPRWPQREPPAGSSSGDTAE